MKLLTMACSVAGRYAKGLKRFRLWRRFAAFIRCASSAPVEGATNEWLEPVTGAEYDALSNLMRKARFPLQEARL